MPCAEGISLTAAGAAVMMVHNFASSINKAKSEVQIPWLGVDNNARRTRLSFRMPALVCSPDSQTSLVLTHKPREWVWSSKYEQNFYSRPTDNNHVSLRRIISRVTSAAKPFQAATGYLLYTQMSELPFSKQKKHWDDVAMDKLKPPLKLL